MDYLRWMKVGLPQGLGRGHRRFSDHESRSFKIFRLRVESCRLQYRLPARPRAFLPTPLERLL